MTSEYLSAALLGLVEGLTEFIPVSSTGHLILVGSALGLTGEKEKTFEVFIQLGAILSVVVLYRARFTSFIQGLFPLSKWLNRKTYLATNSGLEGSAGIINIALATLPALIFGALLHKQSKALFFPESVALALITGGILFLIAEKFKRQDTKEIAPLLALAIGVFQVFALWPGMSRSGSTIVGGLLLGLNRKNAAEFSFLAAVPIIAAAALFDLLKGFSLFTTADVPLFAIGLSVSFLAGMLSIRLLVAVLNRFTLVPFAIYRILLGAAVLLLSPTN